ncbi:hypothetical protein EIP86_009995 [Pleurotus ostreatoroseus]|nr:hypothetical protein EIP86_009995 [Pleurotus ostreatoroseus]
MHPAVSQTAAQAKLAFNSTLDYAFHIINLVISLPSRLFIFFFNLWYMFCETLLIFGFKPRSPRGPQQPTKPHGRIAIVGAGLTGVSSAAHAIAHGFDVVIFEQMDKTGGIWANVNATSGLQLNSLLYRFHPAVKWSRAFPKRDEILSEITRVWKEYQLEDRTRFNTRVTSVRRASRDEIKDLYDEDDLVPAKQGHARWVINDGRDGVFDAIIVTVGTCGDPNMITLPGMPGYKEKQQEKREKEQKEKSEKERPEGESEDSSHKNPASAWTENTEQPKAQDIAHDQDEKKAEKFFTPAEAYHGEGDVDVSAAHEESPTQDNGAWEKYKPKEDAWAIGRDQTQKKDEGFPTPGEAFEVGKDTQKGSEDQSLAPTTDGRTRKDSSSKKTSGKRDAKEKRSSQDEKHTSEDDDNVFQGPIFHSSQLDREDAPTFEGKTVVVVGGGASAVESVETALAKGAKECIMLVRDDKWIIPRNIFVDTLIALQPFGRQMPLSFLWEKFITLYNYWGVSDLTPAHLGLFEGTPVVNDEFLGHVRKGRCKYIRGDTECLTSRGVLVNVRGRDSKPGDKGEKKEFDADIVVLATGFKKPDVGFLPADLFPEDYTRPNLYLQTFCTEDWSILMTNSAYMNAIDARILMTFLMDKNARPTPKDMKLWVDCLRFIKRGAKGGALGFFTYMELTIWLALFHIFRLDRLKWLFFIMQGWGVSPAEYRK